MISRVLAHPKKLNISYVCQWIRPETFRCGKCSRGTVLVWMKDNRQTVCMDRKACRVCGSNFTVELVQR